MARIKTQADLTGILADPAVAAQLKDHLLKAMRPEAARLEALVAAGTPVYDGKISKTNPPAGSLKAGVAGAIKPTKKGIAVIVSADKAKRKGTPGDSQRSPDRVATHAAAEARRAARVARNGLPFVAKPLSLKGGRRYGDVPYGVFVNNETGFLDDPVLAQQGQTLRAINNAVGEWVAGWNRKPIVTPIRPPPA